MAKKIITIDDANIKEDRLTANKTIEEQLYQAGKYEVTKDHKFKVTFYLDKIVSGENERWVVLDRPTVTSEEHWAEFRMWTYEEEVELRKMATAYDAMKRMHFIDHDALNHLKIQRLLLAWSLEKENVRLKLHRVQGTLTDESYKMFMKLFPNIVKRIVDGMNEVLDFNG